MKNRYITFSIITPAYNSAKYIQKCIDSVCNVDYSLSRVEHIIIDDGSTDNTQAIVKRNMRKFPHIKYYYKKNGNWGSVINYAKHNKLAKNKYVLILDSDDRITPQAFKLVNKKSKNCDIFYGSFIMTDFKKKNFPVLKFAGCRFVRSEMFPPANSSPVRTKKTIKHTWAILLELKFSFSYQIPPQMPVYWINQCWYFTTTTHTIPLNFL